MRNLPAQVVAARAQRAGIISLHLVWITGRKIVNGVTSDIEESIGFWNGDQPRDFNVEGQTRTYYAMGTLIGIDPIIIETGLIVREHKARLSGIAPELELLLRGYDVRLSPAEIHRVEFDVHTENLLSAPEMVVKGIVDAAPFSIGAEGDETVATITILSNAIDLTRALTTKKSDESLRARAPDDDFMLYTNASSSQGDVWGGKNYTGDTDKEIFANWLKNQRPPVTP